MNKTKHFTELLLPAGNPESFYAAIEGSANAIYLGLPQFNARNRAKNFTMNQLQIMLDFAKSKGVKVYITLNTVIKNMELPLLMETLHMLTQLDISAVIIQDWGVYYLIKKHFPKLTVHASTQMGNHNSLGADFSSKKDFERVILARELTLAELQTISSKTKIELEVFVHGALCYSFSGMCLFSSYLGGQGANRGLCKQPCRRTFTENRDNKYIFCLKDNQLIDYIPDLQKAGIASLKIEGRMRTADYVLRVAKAYRKVLDNNSLIDEAKNDLLMDMGREKTSYFIGGDVKNVFTDTTNTGYFIGLIKTIRDNSFIIETNHKLEKGDRIRIRSKNGDDRCIFKVNEFKNLSNQSFEIEHECKGLRKGDSIFLTNTKLPFPTKIKSDKNFPFIKKLPQVAIKQKLSEFRPEKPVQKEEIFVRIDKLDWLRKIHFESVNNIILNLSKKEWEKLDLKAPFLKKNSNKLHFELPKFIPEGQIEFYQNIFLKIFKSGYKNFIISHLSQKEILPKGAYISSNENVYAFNDAALQMLKNEGIKNHILPQENDYPNLLKSKFRSGIMPVYFYPHLFFSRMPVILSDEDNKFTDIENKTYKKLTKDGLTYIIPDMPVSFVHYKNKLINAGYKRFLIDLTFEKPSKNILNKLLNRLKHSEQVLPSTNFNFKAEMK